jgi:hypothetical protein
MGLVRRLHAIVDVSGIFSRSQQASEIGLIDQLARLNGHIFHVGCHDVMANGHAKFDGMIFREFAAEFSRSRRPPCGAQSDRW